MNIMKEGGLRTIFFFAFFCPFYNYIVVKSTITWYNKDRKKGK